MEYWTVLLLYTLLHTSPVVVWKAITQITRYSVQRTKAVEMCQSPFGDLNFMEQRRGGLRTRAGK